MAGKILQFRVVKGIDLTEDSRIRDPEAFKEISNLYPKEVGALVKRPGSTVLAGATTSGGTGFHYIEKKDLNVKGKIKTGYHGYGTMDFKLNDAFLSLGKNVQLDTIYYPRAIIGIHRLEFDDGEVITIGATDFTIGDNVWYLANGKFRVVPTFEIEATGRVVATAGTTNERYTSFEISGISQETTKVRSLITSNGNPFFFLNIHGFLGYDISPAGQKSADTLEYFGVVVNGVDPPMAIERVTDDDGYTGIELIAPETTWDQELDEFGATADYVNLWAPNHAVVYNGSVVYAGYKYYDSVNDEEVNHKHFLAFSDPWAPFSVGINSNIQVGENPAEEVEALGINTVETDTQGMKGQLVAFTKRRVVIYDGLPPSRDDPTGVEFSSVAEDTHGCISPRSVVKTPYGLVYLASDENIYLIHGTRITPIGTAIQPALEELKGSQYRKACAWYEDGFYKLSLPEGGNNFASVQYWADLRRAGDTRSRDFGVTWTGPHNGQYIGCVYVDRAIDRTNERKVYGGSSVDGRVYELSVDGTFTDPKTPKHESGASEAVPIQVELKLPILDSGDIHTDKEVQAFRFQAGTDRPTDLEVRVIAESNDNCTTEGEDWDVALLPCQPVLGPITTAGLTNFQLDTHRPGSGKESVTDVTRMPSQRLVGRTISASISEDADAASNQADISIKDVAIEYDVFNRRPQ